MYQTCFLGFCPKAVVARTSPRACPNFIAYRLYMVAWFGILFSLFGESIVSHPFLRMLIPVATQAVYILKVFDMQGHCTEGDYFLSGSFAILRNFPI